MNITFDPTRPEQFASYGFDDDGVPAEKHYIIEKGILERALGSVVSQTRAGIPGVANSRADAGTARRSTAWPTSTSSRATRRSTR